MNFLMTSGIDISGSISLGSSFKMSTIFLMTLTWNCEMKVDTVSVESDGSVWKSNIHLIWCHEKWSNKILPNLSNEIHLSLQT